MTSAPAAMVSSNLKTYIVSSGSMSNVQPVCLKPSSPPGASTTPSREMNSVTMISRMMGASRRLSAALILTTNETSSIRQLEPTSDEDGFVDEGDAELLAYAVADLAGEREEVRRWSRRPGS